MNQKLNTETDLDFQITLVVADLKKVSIGLAKCITTGKAPEEEKENLDMVVKNLAIQITVLQGSLFSPGFNMDKKRTLFENAKDSLVQAKLFLQARAAPA